MIDSNIWISGFLFNGNEMKILIEIILSDVVPAVCRTIINELEVVLLEKFHFSKDEVVSIIGLICSFSSIEKDVDLPNGHVDNDMEIINSAQYGSCKFLLTGDKRLLEIGEAGSVSIVNTNEIRNILQIDHSGYQG